MFGLIHVFCFLLIFSKLSSGSAGEGQTNITAEPGHNVSLPCRAGHDGDIASVHWIRPDLKPEDVLFCRDGRCYHSHQHPSFQNRVDLQDRQMKDGDVSLILKNLTINDTGTYECRVQRETDGDNMSIHLEVSPPGTTQDRRNQDRGDKDGGEKDGRNQNKGHLGLVVGLSAVGIVGIIGMVVGVWFYKRHEKKNSAPPPDLL
ncbi:coxsackievirus and adenovirus receptor-like [Melanotaenia boesemani]|uniref:coxsackievirus and adenovirus receptor-like n=1 Tax=Melanotaenia boesemani TaxID=1250792 RepID=UPI001C03E168|nr:coxsackievirus and adenovirus receptor-like [Melanotaenia boesemani]